MTDSVVIYFYSDPNYRGDLTTAMASLKERGFRVVRGDNADELLFLLQVGRPAAVVYTLAGADARSSTSYQMVSRRALDLLVPIFLVGPDDVRDGVVLVLPDGGRVVESHIPFHAMGDLIARVDVTPPSTPSRPPAVLHQETIGKGKTILNWKGGGPIPSRAPEWRAQGETLHGQVSAEQLPAAAPQGSIPPVDPRILKKGGTLLAQVPPPARETMPARKHPPAEAQVEDGASTPAPAAARAYSGAAVSDPPAPRRGPPASQAFGESAAPRRSVAARAVFAVSGLAVLAAIAVVVVLATRPSEPAPEPLPRGPGLSSEQVRPSPGGALPAPGEIGAAGRSGQPGATAEPDPGGVAVPEPATRPDEAGPAVGPDPAAFRPRADGSVLFPGHFREGTATFWFAGEWEETGFWALVEGSAPGSIITVTGHPTAREVESGQGSLGTSRAWAVEKYLVRRGVVPTRIQTARGKAVEARDDIDARGWPRNRWVDVTFR